MLTTIFLVQYLDIRIVKAIWGSEIAQHFVVVISDYFEFP